MTPSDSLIAGRVHRGVKAGHGQEVLKEMLGQIAPAQFLVTPVIERRIDVRDGPTECVGAFRRDARILRPRPPTIFASRSTKGRRRGTWARWQAGLPREHGETLLAVAGLFPQRVGLEVQRRQPDDE